MSDLQFSVITPVYNREQSIGHAISSVLAQTYSSWELILVDDGSIDNTGAICKKYAEKDQRVHYIYQTNSGVCAARNAGILRAVGDYIVFLDSDNTLKNNMLEILCSSINLHTFADMICFGFDNGQNSRTFSYQLLSREIIRTTFLPTHINIYPQSESFLTNYVWNKCYKRSFLSENHILFDQNRHTWEDAQFIINCLDYANAVLLIDDILYSIHSDAEIDHLSSNFFEDQIFHYIEDATDYKQRFQKEFDFSSLHYCRSNFNVITSLFSRAVQIYGKKAIPLIEQAINSGIVHFWIEHIKPIDAFEERVIYLIKAKGANKIYSLYRLNPAARITRRILRTIKK